MVQIPPLSTPRLLSLLASLLCVLLPVRGSAQSSHVDSTFKFTSVPYQGLTYLHYTTNILVQPDGKIVVNGVFDPPTVPLTPRCFA